MSQNVYDVISNEELDRGERVEMVVDIYESADTVRGHESHTEMEETRTKKIIKTQHSGSRCYRLTAVCLGLLCVLLLAAIIDFTEKLRGGQTAWIGLSYRLIGGAWRWGWVDNSALTTR
ncbi:hypothetical protein SRHO_G00250340 [Serrasalmus rhombeus]